MDRGGNDIGRRVGVETPHPVGRERRMNRVLVIDDDIAVLNYFMILLAQTQRYETKVLSDSTQAFEAIDSGSFDAILLDMDMPVVHGREVLKYVKEKYPEIEVIVVTGVEEVPLAVESMKAGAYDYLCKPIDENRLLLTLDRALERSQLRVEISKLRDQVSLEGLRHKEAFKSILTRDKSFLRVLQRVDQIAESENYVLIWGESGTGKELVARAIHQISRRRDRPFIAVNAGAFASELFSSEFFGHEKGAFTGAIRSKAGFFEEADGGTLLLDEIGELELPVQSKLLRVLQEGEYFRVGSTEKRGSDVRIIACTNRDLADEIEKGRFRRDLYYRLNICSVYLPPLRDRQGDIELLAIHFLEKHNRLNHKSISLIDQDFIDILEMYDFPGNVRELENIIAESVVVEIGRSLSRRSLPRYILSAVATSRALIVPASARKSLADVEAEHIRRMLELADGNRTVTAEILGISRVSLISKIKRYGIDIKPLSGVSTHADGKE
jgi:DNA-binding NtrC family response regulator